LDEKKPDRKPNENRKRPFNRDRRNKSDFDRRNDREFDQRNNRKFDRRNDREFDRRNDEDFDQRSRGPRNIRFGTKFCGECRACKFWIEPRIGRYRCDNSYLPFEIVEIRRDKFTNNITEIVINLLV
jgi:hypothetical protein